MYDVISLPDASLPGRFPDRPYATSAVTTNRIPPAGAQRSHMPLSMCSLLRNWREQRALDPVENQESPLRSRRYARLLGQPPAATYSAAPDAASAACAAASRASGTRHGEHD